MKYSHLQRTDPELYALLVKEIERQQGVLDLIPSENICPEPLLELLGSPLVNKYTEGYSGKRYYPGCIVYDDIERLAIARARAAFELGDNWRVNVQALSGSPANAAIYVALMGFGDTLMGLELSAGGHLTHGSKVSFSGKAFESVQYGVNAETEEIDYEEMEKLAKKHKPRVIVSGTTAYPRKIDFGRIRSIADEVGAYHVADVSHIGGLIIAGAYPSPFPYADVVMMTTHKTLRGPRGAVIFANSASQTAQKNNIDIGREIDKSVFPGMQGGPHNNQTAAIAAMFGLSRTEAYKDYQLQIVKNAAVLADKLLEMNYQLFTGGTDCHMLLIKMGPKELNGSEAEQRLESVGIIANRNTVPGDPSPFRPSGVRMGTPTITSRGMKEAEAARIADLIDSALRLSRQPEEIRRDVLELCEMFPIYTNF